MSAAVKKQWIVDNEPHLRHVKKWCARRRAGETGGAVIELTGLRLEEHRFEYGEAPSARCPYPGCWGERERAQVPYG
jgi:hypothetical protein